MNGFQAIPAASPLLDCPWPGVTSSSRDGKNSSFPPPNKFIPPQAHRVSVSSSSRAHGFSSLGVHCASSSSAGTQLYAEEPTTGVKSATSVMVPGCPGFLALLGTGYREKVFAIVGVKVYSAALYANQLIVPKLGAWKGKLKEEIHCDESFSNAVFHSQLEKSLQIVLVRDIDGETFWDAFVDAISPRIPVPTPIDKYTLSTFHSIFKGRPLKKSTFIFLTWLDSSKMLVSVSSDGWPTAVDAEKESENATFSMLDVFLGAAPASPSLEASAVSSLAAVLK